MISPSIQILTPNRLVVEDKLTRSRVYPATISILEDRPSQLPTIALYTSTDLISDLGLPDHKVHPYLEKKEIVSAHARSAKRYATIDGTFHDIYDVFNNPLIKYIQSLQSYVMPQVLIFQPCVYNIIYVTYSKPFFISGGTFDPVIYISSSAFILKKETL